MQKLIELAALYETDPVEYALAANEAPEEHSFTLDGQEVTVDGNN